MEFDGISLSRTPTMPVTGGFAGQPADGSPNDGRRSEWALAGTKIAPNQAVNAGTAPAFGWHPLCCNKPR